MQSVSVEDDKQRFAVTAVSTWAAAHFQRLSANNQAKPASRGMKL
jgi:hypothetical protein